MDFLNVMPELNNAVFGDKFIMRNGEIAIFHSHTKYEGRQSRSYCSLFIKEQRSVMLWNYDGTSKNDKDYDILRRL